jgi:hypothetical protein
MISDDITREDLKRAFDLVRYDEEGAVTDLVCAADALLNFLHDPQSVRKLTEHRDAIAKAHKWVSEVLAHLP